MDDPRLSFILAIYHFILIKSFLPQIKSQTKLSFQLYDFLIKFPIIKMKEKGKFRKFLNIPWKFPFAFENFNLI